MEDRKFMYDLYDKCFNYIGQDYLEYNKIKEKYSNAVYYMQYDYFTRQRKNLVNIETRQVKSLNCINKPKKFYEVLVINEYGQFCSHQKYSVNNCKDSKQIVLENMIGFKNTNIVTEITEEEFWSGSALYRTTL